MQWELNYREPAKEWIESLPLGNGEIGAMVSGGTRQETIELNLDTFVVWQPEAVRTVS